MAKVSKEIQDWKTLGDKHESPITWSGYVDIHKECCDDNVIVPTGYTITITFESGQRHEFWTCAEKIKAIVLRTGRYWRRQNLSTITEKK